MVLSSCACHTHAHLWCCWRAPGICLECVHVCVHVRVIVSMSV